MKLLSRSFLVLAFLCGRFGSLLPDAVAQPVVFVDDANHDYGPLYREEHSMVGHTFVVQNLGDEPLLIRAVKPSCGCTRAEISRNEIPAGESADLYAELQFKHQIGGERIRVTVHSNDPVNGNLDLGLKGELIRHWYLFPERINAGIVSGSETRTEIVTLTSHHLSEDSAKKVVSIEPDSPYLQVEPLNEPELDRKAGYWEVRRAYGVTVRSGDAVTANAQSQVLFKTDDPDRPEIALPVQWVVEGNLTFDPRSLSLTHDRYRRFSGETLRTPKGKVIELPGDRGRVGIASRTREEFKILDVALPEPFQPIWDSEASRRVGSIEVLLKEVEPGYYDAEMVVTTDLEGEAPLRIPVHGEIQRREPLFSAPSTLSPFGPVFADEIPEVSHTFLIRNGGSRDLELAIAETFGATARLEASRLPPGAVTNLVLSATLANLAGELKPSVTLSSNDPQTARKTFQMRGLVLPHWSFEPGSLRFGSVLEGEAEKKKLILWQHLHSWESPATIEETPVQGDRIRIETVRSSVEYTKSDYGVGETELLVHFEPAGTPGSHTQELVLKVQGESSLPAPRISMEWNLLGDIRTRPSRILVDPSKGSSQKKRTVRVYSKEGTPFSILEAVAPEGVQVIPTDTKPDEYRFEVSISIEEATPENTEILFKTDRPDQLTVRIPVTAPKAD